MGSVAREDPSIGGQPFRPGVLARSMDEKVLFSAKNVSMNIGIHNRNLSAAGANV